MRQARRISAHRTDSHARQLIKDYDLLRQMNANIVRLSHYPHNPLELEILDELGMVAISEIPMVFLREAQMTSPEVLSKSRQMLAEMIRTEKNTTSIMFWSLFIECETDLATTREFVEKMVALTRELDENVPGGNGIQSSAHGCHLRSI